MFLEYWVTKIRQPYRERGGMASSTVYNIVATTVHTIQTLILIYYLVRLIFWKITYSQVVISWWTLESKRRFNLIYFWTLSMRPEQRAIYQIEPEDVTENSLGSHGTRIPLDPSMGPSKVSWEPLSFHWSLRVPWDPSMGLTKLSWESLSSHGSLQAPMGSSHGFRRALSGASISSHWSLQAPMNPIPMRTFYV